MHEEQHTSILFGLPSVTPLTACRAALLLLLLGAAAADTVRVGTDCAVWVRPEADWTRRQLDKKRFHDRETLCHVVSWPGNGTTWGERGEGREEVLGERNGSQTCVGGGDVGGKKKGWELW